MLSKFFKDENGATAIEYGLIASLIFLGCVTAFFSFGESATAMYQKIANTVNEATGS